MGGIKRVAGTSAGSIVALLLALGFGSNDISKFVAQLDFTKFMHNYSVKQLFSNYGLYQGESALQLFRSWIAGALAMTAAIRVEMAIREERLTEAQILPTSVSQSQLAEPLTGRELEVLGLLAQRLSNKEIAAQLVILPRTVKRHTLNIYQELDVNGRLQAVDKASELGILA